MATSWLASVVPEQRIRIMNAAQIRASGGYVLYWMIANRRLHSNFSLQRAVELSRELHKPLLVFEPLRCGYRWACDRFHHFVIDGMRDNAKQCKAAGVAYYPYLESEHGQQGGLLAAFAQRACAIVTDDFPCFFLPRMLEKAAAQLEVRLEAVDSNGIAPMRAADRTFHRAFDFRRHLQRTLQPHLQAFPMESPLDDYTGGSVEPPAEVRRHWPAADLESFSQNASPLAAFPIDHGIQPSEVVGGAVAATKCLQRFLKRGLDRYHDERSDPDADAASGLSPYLHFGHISTHDVFSAVAKQQGWKRSDIAGKATGSAQHWWGGSPPLESFFDELITWRELGFNMCARESTFFRYESLPAWAKATLAEHAHDPRPQLYTLEQLAAADTYDEVWNASQRQLIREGRIQNYLRMLWGKKILEWTRSPQEALRVMIELNNRYALDGRNPNSYSGIFWVLGRYDRAWGPERPIFGKIRYMSSDNTLRKLQMKQYLAKFAA